ncbi:hypothetical protein Gotur_001809 [Gossypium turneri]
MGKSNSKILVGECFTKLQMGMDEVPRGGSALPSRYPLHPHVEGQHQVEVLEFIECEPYPSSFPAWHPAKQNGISAVRNRNNTVTILSNLKDYGHGEVKVRISRVTPAAINYRQSFPLSENDGFLQCLLAIGFNRKGDFIRTEEAGKAIGKRQSKR